MTLSSIFLILRKQIISKWGRFILSAGGIMVGVWALTLTTGLSLGLSSTIITAINSQTLAKDIQIYREINESSSFFEVQGPPVFRYISFDEINSLAESDDRIASISNNNIMRVFTPAEGFTDNCRPDIQIDPNLDPRAAQTLMDESKLCESINVLNDSFVRFYENNKTNWVGDTDAPTKDEVVVCFSCGALEFNTLYNAEKPEDLIGKEVTFQYDSAPSFANVNEVFDVTDQSGEDLSVKGQVTFTAKVKAVVDDRSNNSFGGLSPIYIDESKFIEGFKEIDPAFDTSNYGGVEWNVFLNNFEDLDDIITLLKDKQYLVFSLGETVVQAVQVAFIGLNFFLSGFGIIALIASVFGIISVMTISVLERKKEIGILKSMGAKSRSIFTLFILESSFIGLIGWLFGTLIAVLFGYGISAGVEFALTSNESWKENLENLNITDFNPDFPWWLFVSTLAIAIVFTVLSGLVPALKAAKQNPVDVLRGE